MVTPQLVTGDGVYRLRTGPTVTVGERCLLLIYDRLANGWSPIPDDMRETTACGSSR